MQPTFNKYNSTWGYATVAIFFACMIWVSPMLSLRDNDVLGRMITVTSIIILTMWHRVAGIIALSVVIAVMQNRLAMEGFTLPKAISNPIVGAVSSDDFFSWKTPDEFKQKYCIKGLSDNGLGYILNSKLLNIDASGNYTFNKDTLASLNKIDDKTATTENGCITTPERSGGINKICDPKCNWKIKTVEGFTATIENSPIMNAKNLIKDNVQKAKTMTESFFSR